MKDELTKLYTHNTPSFISPVIGSFITAAVGPTPELPLPVVY